MKMLFRSVVLSLGVIGSTAVMAQSIDAVIEQARSARAVTQQRFNERATQFEAADAATRQRLMTEATAQRKALSDQVAQKTVNYTDNDGKIVKANGELRAAAAKLGLGEVFGLARQVANDQISPLQQSMIGAQYPSNDRIAFLQGLAANTHMLTVDQLERLWFELSREMAAQGEVAKFNGSVVLPGGASENAQIVRIGPFTATSGDRYLSYLPELNRLTVLPRQLPQPFQGDASRLASATNGYVQATVDSTHGVLLGMYVERPNFVERVKQGEEVAIVIITVGALGAVAFIFQLLYLIKTRLAVSSQLRQPHAPKKNNPLGRVLLAFKGDGSTIEEDTDILELRLSEAVMKEAPGLERSQAFLRLCVAAGPLLGLIGTVVGMIITFQSITETGSSDPKMMATGIGQAMIATVLGLGVAVPLLFGNALLTSLSKSIMQILDEQSAGILAETLEKRRGKTNA
ncbi:MAG: MotA/TolQ/ExbB proton channel family protein [Pseudomonadales bacterium]|jgi:biopolymer transport protein ExbB|nr:MotA/TolQ/ExbB proton channel family protein [Pseudomonadales bacterium]